MGKIYVYSNDVKFAKQVVTKAYGEVTHSSKPKDIADIIIFKEAKDYISKRGKTPHKEDDFIFTTDKDAKESIQLSTLFNLDTKLPPDDKAAMFKILQGEIMAGIASITAKPTSIIDIDITSLQDVFDKEYIASFIHQYKTAYKKPIIIITKDNKKIGVFDSEEDFNEEEKLDVKLTVDEYVGMMMTALTFNARHISIERA